MKTIKVLQITCKRCDHEWISKTEKKPLMCPRCKTYKWNEKKKKLLKKQLVKEESKH